jgi:hypothetical protein
MSDEKPKEQPEDEALSEAELAQLEEPPAVSALLKRSLAKTEDLLGEPKADAELLASVQRKLRKRSKGKFYGDGWSTSATRMNYTLIAVATHRVQPALNRPQGVAISRDDLRPTGQG